MKKWLARLAFTGAYCYMAYFAYLLIENWAYVDHVMGPGRAKTWMTYLLLYWAVIGMVHYIHDK